MTMFIKGFSKKTISLFLAVVCMISIFSTMSFTASAATANAKVSEVSKVTIQNVGTGQYLNFDYGTLSNGTFCRVWPWDGSTEQLWSIDHVSGSTYRILTYKSSKYCLDVYRGNSKLKAGQKCDIWKTADDTVAQNITFYRCDDGSYILRMANNSNLALAATASKDRVKLATFNASSKSQKWIFKDAKGNKIDIMNSSTSTTSSGITSSAYKKTGTVYTISGTKYYQAKTTRAYNGVAKDSVFYVDSKGVVVNNATTLNKLYTLELFNNIRSNQKSAASLWASAADGYYNVCTNIAATEKMGTLIGNGSGLLLSIGSGNSISLGNAALQLSEEMFASSDTVKSAVLLGLIRVYANNTIAYGNKASSLMKSNITDYDTMLTAANAYAECSASFAAVDFLAGEQVREMANSSTWKELSKYFYNVFCGLADSVISDFSASEIKGYIEDGIALGEIATDCGAIKAYNNKLSEQKKYLSTTYPSAKTTADKLSKNEWNSLVGKTVASIKNGSSYTAWYNSSKNISAKGGYIGECTWYALGRFGEVTGVKLTKAPHAKSWLSTNKNNSNVKVVYGANKIVPQSIAVDTSGTYGHVMFIEHVEYNANGNPQTVYFTECNWDCNSTYNVGKDCVVKKLSYSQFVAQRGPDGYIIAK